MGSKNIKPQKVFSNKPLSSSDFSTDLKKYTFLNTFSEDYPLRENVFPDGLIRLTIGGFNQELKPNLFPLSLEYLCFNIIFVKNFDTSLLPPNLKELVFDHGFNSSLDCLPQQLEKINLGDDFNQPLNPGMLPSTLTELEFGSKFNQIINQDVLPFGLKVLKFGSEFDQILIGLPSNLKEIHFNKSFNKFNSCVFPFGAKIMVKDIGL